MCWIHYYLCVHACAVWRLRILIVWVGDAKGINHAIGNQQLRSIWTAIESEIDTDGISNIQISNLVLDKSYGSNCNHTCSDVLGLAQAQSPGLGLALVGLGFGNPEPGPNSGLAKAQGLAWAQAWAYIPYMVFIADCF